MRLSTRRFVITSVVAFATLHAAMAHAGTITWVNGTGLASEIDYVTLQFPSTVTVTAGTSTPVIYGQIFESGITTAPGPDASIAADLGFGPAGTDPRTSLAWTWVSAVFNVQVGNNDEYKQTFVAPLVNGTYSYTYRFSKDGTNYTAADLDGAGAGLTFDATKLGVMTVTGGIVAAPEPATQGFVAFGALFVAVALLTRRT